jgi:hypothetical protein
MRLSLRSIGGFTGPAGAVTRTVDVATLSEDRRCHAQKLVEAAHLFDRPEKALLPAPKPWDMRYVLDVDDGGRSRRVELHLGAVDTSLKELVSWLEDEAPIQ